MVNAALVASDFADDTVELFDAGLVSTVATSRPGTLDTEGLSDALNEHVHREADGTPLTVRVPARTLGGLLDELGSPHVDLLCLDVEGFEAQVISGLDLNRHVPDLILVEILDPARQESIEDVLRPLYEPVDRLSPHDYLYRLARYRP